MGSSGRTTCKYARTISTTLHKSKKTGTYGQVRQFWDLT